MPKRRKHRRQHLKLILWLLIFFALLALSIFLLHRHTDDMNTKTKISPTSVSSNSSKPVQVTFNKNLHSINIASSPWVVVNKGRILPSSYIPSGLTTPDVALRFGSSSSEMKMTSGAASALEKLFNGAAMSGLHLMLSSGYRSYTQQVGLYNNYVSGYGQALADTFSARAGHSEHQTGLVGDVEPTSRQCELDVCFGSLPEGKWLAANAYKYGFIVRYPANKTSVTGYQYEPWHMRYVGIALSSEMHKTKITTLEEFFGLRAFTNYPAKSYMLGDG